jgi:hypothetical protein
MPKPDTVKREYAGKYIAQTVDGRIVAVASSFGACERKAGKLGYAATEVAITRVPKGRIVGH